MIEQFHWSQSCSRASPALRLLKSTRYNASIQKFFYFSNYWPSSYFHVFDSAWHIAKIWTLNTQLRTWAKMAGKIMIVVGVRHTPTTTMIAQTCQARNHFMFNWWPNFWTPGAFFQSCSNLDTNKFALRNMRSYVPAFLQVDIVLSKYPTRTHSAPLLYWKLHLEEKVGVRTSLWENTK